MPNPLGAKAGEDVLARLDELSAKLETERRMREVTDHIHTASLDEIIISVREDRLPIASNSIAGYTALKKKIVRVSGAYDPKVLAAIDPILRFDAQWDK